MATERHRKQQEVRTNYVQCTNTGYVHRNNRVLVQRKDMRQISDDVAIPILQKQVRRSGTTIAREHHRKTRRIANEREELLKRLSELGDETAAQEEADAGPSLDNIPPPVPVPVPKLAVEEDLEDPPDWRPEDHPVDLSAPPPEVSEEPPLLDRNSLKVMNKPRLEAYGLSIEANVDQKLPKIEMLRIIRERIDELKRERAGGED